MQDAWKATSRLTVNYGVRFSTFSPWLLRGRTDGAALILDRYDIGAGAAGHYVDRTSII